MCPPGTDQTMRGPQRWSLLAPRLRQCINFGGQRYHNNPFEPQMFHSTTNWDAWSLLARPDPCTSSTPSTHTSFKSSSSLLLSLPLELHHLILSSLSSVDILSLCLTHPLLSSLVTPYITSTMLSHSASWANSELAFIGSYLEILPPSFLADNLAYKSVDGMQDVIEKGEQVLWGRPPYRGMCPARRMNWAAVSGYVNAGGPEHEDWYCGREDGKEEEQGYCQVKRLNEWRGAADEIEKKGWVGKEEGKWLRGLVGMYDAFGVGQGCEEERGTIWYLRNLDSREVVRCTPSVHQETKRVIAHVVPPKGAKWLRVDQVLSMRMRWCAYSRDDEERTKMVGSWAGHRFDIVSQKRHTEEVEKEDAADWKDVGIEILKEAAVSKCARLRHALAMGKRINEEELTDKEKEALRLLEQYDYDQFLEGVEGPPDVPVIFEGDEYW